MAKNYSFTGKWPKSVEKSGFTQVPNILLTNLYKLKLNSTETNVLIQILSFKWDNSNPWPSAETIAKRMACSVDTVRRAWAQLERKHILKRVIRPGHSNEYDFRPLAEILEILAAPNGPPQKRRKGYANLPTLPSSYLHTKEDAAKDSRSNTQSQGFTPISAELQNHPLMRT